MLCSQKLLPVDPPIKAFLEPCTTKCKATVNTSTWRPHLQPQAWALSAITVAIWDVGHVYSFHPLTANAAARMHAESASATQVFHLKEAGVECGYLSGTQDYAESREIMQGLTRDPPAVKILFVTPEKVARSDYLMRTLDSLHARCQLARPLPPATRYSPVFSIPKGTDGAFETPMRWPAAVFHVRTLHCLHSCCQLARPCPHHHTSAGPEANVALRAST